MYKYKNISERENETHLHDEFMKIINYVKSTSTKMGSPIPQALLNLADKDSNGYKKYVGRRIMRKQLEPREDPESLRGISDFTGRVRGMHVFEENFTYVSDFVIFEDISSVIDPRLSQVVLGKPFVELSNMPHDLSLGIMKFTNGAKEIAYKIPHKIEQFDSLSELEKEHTQSVYFRNEEDKKRRVDYVMSKILGFYKECLEL
ncbi:hypothetical protein Tco_0152302 [Tanacetum coccineum]